MLTVISPWLAALCLQEKMSTLLHRGLKSPKCLKKGCLAIKGPGAILMITLVSCSLLQTSYLCWLACCLNEIRFLAIKKNQSSG